MTASVDPQTKIRQIIASAIAKAGPRAPLHAVYIDRPFYDQVCRAHAVSPASAPHGVKLGGVAVKPFDVLAPA